jgi:hypothetical protein
MSYLDATNDIQKKAALTPDVGLCCTTTQFGNSWFRNSKNNARMAVVAISAQDLINNLKVLYVGVGGGMELQFAYLS